jgi:hypothetical protein
MLTKRELTQFIVVVVVFLDRTCPFQSSSLCTKQSPLACLLKHWKDLDPNLKKTTLIFLCTEAWPQYPLEDQEKWPSQGSLNYNTILQLDLFCKREKKWIEVPYIQLFLYL